MDWYTLYSHTGKQVSRWNGKKGHVKKVDNDMAKQVDSGEVDSDMGKQVDRWMGRW